MNEAEISKNDSGGPAGRPSDVLVVRPGALGDAVLTLPALCALDAADTGALTVLGTPASWAFLNDAEGCPRVEDFGSREWLGLFADGAAFSDRVAGELKRVGSAVLYLTDDDGTRGIERRLRVAGVETVQTIPPPVASDSNPESNFPPLPAQDAAVLRQALTAAHASRRLLDPLAEYLPRRALAAAYDADLLGMLQWLRPAETHFDALMRLPRDVGETAEFIAIHPGSGGRKKCWSAARFAELTARLWRHFERVPVVFFGPADEAVAREFEAAIPPDVVWIPIREWHLREVLALLGRCAFYVGNDSGLSHLAAQVTSVLSIFGPTDPAVWVPVGRSVRVVKAPGGDLQGLTVDAVFEAAVWR